MRFVLALTFLAAACGTSDDRPIGPGGGVGGGGGAAVDGGVTIDGSTAESITGRLCLVDDMRVASLCPVVTGIGGIGIENVLTGDTTTSTDTGGFTLPGAEGDYTQLRVAVGDDDYRDVLVPIALISGQAVGVELPLVPTLVWDDLLTVVGLIEPGQTASLAAYFVKGILPVEDVSLQPPAGTDGVPIYDGPSGPNDWSVGDASGQYGAAILLGIPTADPSLDIVIQPLGQDPVTAIGVPVEPDVLTFITVPLP